MHGEDRYKWIDNDINKHFLRRNDWRKEFPVITIANISVVLRLIKNLICL